MQIIVTDMKVTTKEGTSAKGKPYTIHEQQALVHKGLERLLIQVPLDDVAKPYPPGNYTVDPSSFVKGPWGQLEIGRLQLLPTKV